MAAQRDAPVAAAEASADVAGTNDARFHAAVESLEGAIMDEDFRMRVAAFYAEHCDAFAPTDAGEFKLEWTERFKEYTAMMEEHLAAALDGAVSDFDMGWFMSELEARADDGAIDGEVFDMLLSLGDFEDFVSTMQSHYFEKAAGEASSSGAELGQELSATAMAGLAPSVTRFVPEGGDGESPASS